MKKQKRSRELTGRWKSTSSAKRRRADPAKDPGPVKLFDNLYAIPGPYSVGNAVVYVIPTSAGIMLIDAGHAKDVESVVLPGLKTLGLDPANIKIVILAHGHEDHYGGAAYLQQHYGARIAMAAADWDFINIPRPPAAGGNAATPAPLPKRDMMAFEGVPITLGEESVTPVFIPGHTPGSLGLIFPVKDGGKTHVVGMVGGGFIAQGTGSQVQEFIDSLQHFEDWTKMMKVDVEIQNHPVFDGFADKTGCRSRAKTRRAKPLRRRAGELHQVRRGHERVREGDSRPAQGITKRGNRKSQSFSRRGQR